MLFGPLKLRLASYKMWIQGVSTCHFIVCATAPRILMPQDELDYGSRFLGMALSSVIVASAYAMLFLSLCVVSGLVLVWGGHCVTIVCLSGDCFRVFVAGSEAQYHVRRLFQGPA